MKQLQSISIVVPCYNEEGSLRRLAAQLQTSLESAGYSWNLILVDDGSRDDTARIITELAQQHAHIKGVLLSRNFGKESAMLAGLTYADGDATLIMDADMQHPPQLVPQLVEKMVETGADQVVAIRDRVGDSRFRSALARLYYKIANRLMEDVELIDGAGDFRLLSRRAVETLLALDERQRFSKGLFSWIGYPTETIRYANQASNRERSTWSFSSLLDYGMDGIMSFNAKPLRVVAVIGGIGFAIAFIYFIWVLVQWALNGVDAPGYITMIASVIGFGGIQLLALGVIGEYVGRIYREVKARPHFVVKDELGF
ncbi:MAG: glycosyltransferase family 2 protein [Actinomycetaceae bacterium]|nr:glycosyltransferase family 2 protein [Actinomycetaceae bacterium]